jgi:deazaflavin-dependent oxidoreductase (nitroreductase family)
MFWGAMVFERLTDEDFAYVTTTGRRTGRPHTVEIWFALSNGRMFLLSGGGDRADWVKNIRNDGRIRVRVGSRDVAAVARIVSPGSAEEARARQLLDAKYMGWREGKRLSSWARTALPVAIELGRG